MLDCKQIVEYICVVFIAGNVTGMTSFLQCEHYTMHQLTFRIPR